MKKTDILIVGAGPAGLGAAIEAAKAGTAVLLIDENLKAGGQLFKQIHKFFGSEAHYAGIRGFQIGEMLLEEAARLGVETWLDTRALGLLDDGSVGVMHEGHFERIEAKKTILATGAKENALAFKGWTLPGVMTAGAAQTFSNVHGIRVGDRVLTVGSGNVGLIVSYQLMQAGAEIVSLVEAAPEITGYRVHAGKIERAGVPIRLSHTIVEARGDGHVEEVVIAAVDDRFEPIPGTEEVLKADTVILAVGLNPRTELASMFRCETGYEAALGGILPLHDACMMTTNPDVYVCGDLAGVEEANTALDEGRLAGLCAAERIGCRPETFDERREELAASLKALRSGEHGKKRLEGKARVTERWQKVYDNK